MLARDALQSATQQLAAAGIAQPQLDAQLLLLHTLGISREQYHLQPTIVMQPYDIKRFNAFILRRITHEPIAYILGKKEFWSLDFIVTTDTLIPRPDSETLIEAALKRAKIILARQCEMQSQVQPLTILDIGTGSGCLLISMLHALKNAQGIGVDKSEAALKIAKQNAAQHGVLDRSHYITSDWCDAVDGMFDIIISNPPYIANTEISLLMPDVVKYEPHGALFAGEDGLDTYRAIIPQAKTRLNRGGYIVLEVGHQQAKTVVALLVEHGFENDEIGKDLAGISRCVIGRLN